MWWGVSAGATSYEYCIDTTNDSACSGWVSVGSATSAGVGPLAYGTAYYWQVRANNSFGTAYADGGAYWHFTTGGPVSVVATFKSLAVNDGWVLESGETTSTGGTLNSTASTCRVGDDALDRQYRSILDFNTATLPDTAVITSVVLKIKYSAFVGTNPFTTHGKLTVDMRTGAFHGILGLEKADFQAPASRSAVGTFGTAAVGGWYTATMNTTAYTRVSLGGHTQLRLRFATGDNDDTAADYLAFLCGNAAAASRPKLIITYYLP